MKGFDNKQLKSIISDLEDIKTRIGELRDDAEVYQSERSEKWMDSDVGQLFEEHLGTLDEAMDSTDEIISRLSDIE